MADRLWVGEEAADGGLLFAAGVVGRVGGVSDPSGEVAGRFQASQGLSFLRGEAVERGGDGRAGFA